MTWQTEKNYMLTISCQTQIGNTIQSFCCRPLFHQWSAFILRFGFFFLLAFNQDTSLCCLSGKKKLLFIRMNHFLQIPDLHSSTFKASDDMKRCVQGLLCQILYVAYYRKPILLQVFTWVWCCWKKNDLSVCSGCLFLKNQSFFLVGWCCESSKHNIQGWTQLYCSHYIQYIYIYKYFWICQARIQE